ncbi:MAG TPA: gliding motility lipoprotein GldD [Paludibacteraceae bacterium]|nr:gliding motility lipoprotein GldD [Paludibacteraceae bacterium]
MNKHLLKTLTIGVILVLFISCNRKQTPRPYGYFRVDLPSTFYRMLDTLDFPYRFEISSNANVAIKKPKQVDEKYWIDINYPKLNATIYCSYKSIHGNFNSLSEDTRKIVYKHTVRADAIQEKVYENPSGKVYGILYELKGNTASPVQFVLTDSIRHFFRGALYFNNVPNKDSIAPMLDFVRKDIIRLMESFEWKP